MALVENLIESPELSQNIIQEARDKTLEIDGTPDFSIYLKDSKSLIGFVECKKITADLKELSQSEQIQKYSKTIKTSLLQIIGSLYCCSMER